MGRGHPGRAHRGAGAPGHAADRRRAGPRRHGPDRRAGRRRAPHAPRPPDPDASRRARPDPRARGRHARHGVRRHDHPHRLRFVRPGTGIAEALAQRTARWAGRSHVDYSFHVTLCGALPLAVFDEMREAIEAGFPSFKVFTTDVLPPHPNRPSFRLDFGRIELAMSQAARHGGLMVVHARGRRAGADRLRALPRRGPAGRDEHAPRPHEALGAARVRPDDRARARDRRRRLLRPHLRAGRASRPSRRRGRSAAPVYAETLHQYACFDAEHYKTPRGFCAHTYPSLKLPEDREALWRGLRGRRRLDAGDGRVPDQPRAEAARPDDRGRDRREPRRGGAHGHRVHRGRREARDVARAVRRHHRDERRADLRPPPAEGRHRAGQRRRPRPDRPGDPEDARAGRLPRERLQPLGGLGRVRLAGHHAPPRQGDRRPRAAPRCSSGTGSSSRDASIPSCCAAPPAEPARRVA